MKPSQERFHSKSKSQDITCRVNRLLKSFESVARLRRYELGPAEIEQILTAAESALSRTRVMLQVPNHKKMTFLLQTSPK